MSADNIVRFFDTVPDDIRASSQGWYDSARALALELSPDDIRYGAGVIAALSPMLPWPRNVKLARMIFDGAHDSTLPCLKRNAWKAWIIRKGADPLNILSGEKVLSFYKNILDPSSMSVTIDRHAVDIALDSPGYYQQNGAPNKSEYNAFVKMYDDATAIVNAAGGTSYTSSQLQAMTWTYWRKTRANNYHGEA